MTLPPERGRPVRTSARAREEIVRKKHPEKNIHPHLELTSENLNRHEL
jgi:hypothetical protein